MSGAARSNAGKTPGNAMLAALVALLFVPARPAGAASPPGPAPAADASDANRVAAREQAARGLELFDARRWADAHDAFKKADDLYHAPTLTLAMAQCQRELGRLLAARALYRKLIDEPLAASAPEQFRGARATAQTELAALVKRIPTLTITVSGPGAERARVQLDGAPVNVRDFAAGRELDPGDHAVAAEADGGLAARLSVTVAEGAAQRVDLVLGPAGAAAPARGPLWPAGVALGAGVLGVGIGAVAGAVASGKSDGIRSRCRTIDDRLHCLAADAGERDAASALGTASAAALIAGGAALVAGTVLAIVRPGGSAEPAVKVGVGPGSISIRGSF